MTELTRTSDWSAGAEPFCPRPSDLCDTGRDRVYPPADNRYRLLLGEAAWQRLPLAVRRRFSKRLNAGETITYRGYVARCELSFAGWIAANLARVIGAPLPLDHGVFQPGEVPATVIVEDMPNAAGTGQVWTRVYGRKGLFPQVISSAKRFAGATGLEEYLGLGLVMRLTVSEAAGALVFRSAGYHWQFGRQRINLPAALSPGRCEIVHRAECNANGSPSAHDFTFSLTLTHPLFGQLVHQVACFTDRHASE